MEARGSVMLRRGLTGSGLRQCLLELCTPLRWSLWGLALLHPEGSSAEGRFVCTEHPLHLRSHPQPHSPEVWSMTSLVCQGCIGCETCHGFRLDLSPGRLHGHFVHWQLDVVRTC